MEKVAGGHPIIVQSNCSQQNYKHEAVSTLLSEYMVSAFGELKAKCSTLQMIIQNPQRLNVKKCLSQPE